MGQIHWHRYQHGGEIKTTKWQEGNFIWTVWDMHLYTVNSTQQAVWCGCRFLSKRNNHVEIGGCAMACLGLPGVCAYRVRHFEWIFFIYFIFKTLTYDRVEQVERVVTEGKNNGDTMGTELDGADTNHQGGCVIFGFYFIGGVWHSRPYFCTHTKQLEPHVELRVWGVCKWQKIS